jgi:tetratricopeptide (TPR) repeat protein
MKKNLPRWVAIFPFLYSCASFQAAGDIQQGRQALLLNKPDAALTHLQRAVQSDPNYIMAFGGVFQEGAWTYLGRANYAVGKLPEARQALERALSRYPDDLLARLYLALVVAREGDRQRGAKEIESALRAIYDWLEYLTYNTRYGQYWDSTREIRSEIQRDLAMISGKDIEWRNLIASGESIGKKIEEEIDIARRLEIYDRESITTSSLRRRR